MRNIELKRVMYGKKETPYEDREYQINGKGPVGTFQEFEEAFPEAELEIVDDLKEKAKARFEYENPSSKEDELYSHEIAEPDVNYFPPEYDDSLTIFKEEVKERFQNKDFDKTELE